MILRHIHFRSPVPYLRASALQESLVASFLAAKKSPSTPLPSPALITAQFHPTYTLGRRENNSLSPSQRAHLSSDGTAEVHYALRGGQTTFHGPGQLVAYPILDLKTHGLTPRSYICMLEKSLIATCGVYGVQSMTTENTGVWTDSTTKIAAVGVHMRRYVTSHGVALNVSTDLGWFERIVACGLEGMGMTSLENEGVRVEGGVEEVGRVLVEEIRGRIGCEGVEFEEVDD